ncbi:septum formation family protein [Flexivirga caeni]|nr:septum formation family protein [Flexivirga caeni]
MHVTDHRTFRPTLALATLAIVSLGLTACGGGGSPKVSAPTTNASTSTTPSSSSSVAAPTTGATSSGDSTTTDFRPGQCFDDTINWSLTSCTAKHKLEITAVVKTSQYANDPVKRGILRTWTCNNVVAGYVGSPTAAFSRVLGQPMPSLVDPKSSSEIVCVAAVATESDSGYSEIDYSLKNIIKDKGYLPYRVCTSDLPSAVDSPKIVPCSQPHKAETVGGYIIGKPDGKYPGTKAADDLAIAKCAPLADTYLGARRSDVIAASNHTGAPGWQQGITITACFVEATKGTFLKPLKGMGKQPLSKFQ